MSNKLIFLFLASFALLVNIINIITSFVSSEICSRRLMVLPVIQGPIHLKELGCREVTFCPKDTYGY